MIKKRLILIGLSFIILTIVGGMTFKFIQNKKNIFTIDGISMISKTNGRTFEVYQKGRFHPVFLTGVNIGATTPGSFPGELPISKETYLRWFKQISDLDASVIRVYTTMMPQFYEALFEHNKTSKNKLYLMQGVWINEYDARELGDAFGDNRRLLETFVSDSQDLVDIIHGNKTLDFQYGFAHGTYTYNVSPYVIGWILGVEWDPFFVIGTNNNHPEINHYHGNYLQSKSQASAFEIFLTEVGDRVIQYEVENYGFMRPLSFTNWLTTDHLSHPNEPDLREDMVSVNTENIIATPKFHSGLFAAYHIYPYYPEFMNYSNTYVNHIDHRGEKNPYQGYLKDLYNHLSVPVMVAEFGVPASRGKTHDAIHSGFNQGFLSEKEQGEILVKMLEDIHVSNYFGALIFSWQDEWFKRTWNTMDFDLPDRRPFWSNVQTNEQHFGLLAFDPGADKRIRYVDGNPSDWSLATPLIQNSEFSLYTAFDERYLYIMIDSLYFDFKKDDLIIPIATKANQGSNHLFGTNMTMSHFADFIIHIKNENESSIKVDPYYDPFYYMYAEILNMIPKNESHKIKNSGMFISMYQALSAEIFLPEDQIIVPFSKHNTGKLIFGNGNPNHPDYHSLSDFYHKDSYLEIKIPWQLLNISDPSTKMVLSDFYTSSGFEHESIEGIYIGAYINPYDANSNQIQMAFISWDTWEFPSYHERIKQSYAIVKEGFRKFNSFRNI